MFIDIAFVLLVFLLSIPAVTGYYAYSHGKSFWFWFLIGCFAPILANFILAFICRKEAIKAKKRSSLEMSRYEDEWMENYIIKEFNQDSSKRDNKSN